MKTASFLTQFFLALTSLGILQIHATNDNVSVGYGSGGATNRFFEEVFDSSDGNEPLRLAIAKAGEHIGSENWKEASMKLKEAYTMDPKNPSVFLGFYSFHSAREEYPSAENALVKGLQLHPEHNRLLMEYSKILTIKGDLENAILNGKKAVEAEGSGWLERFWLSQLYSTAGDSVKSQNYLGLAIESLGKQIKEMDMAITRYESQERIVDSVRESEIVTSFGGNTEEVEYDRYITENMVAPREWKTHLAKLKEKKVELEGMLQG